MILEQILVLRGVVIDRWTTVSPSGLQLGLVRPEHLRLRPVVASREIRAFALPDHWDLAVVEFPLAQALSWGSIHWDLFPPSKPLLSAQHSISHT